MKAIVLLSGGQDSTTAMYASRRRLNIVAALSFDYGQRHRSELVAAAKIASMAGIRHHILSMGLLGTIGGSPLTEGGPIEATGGHQDDQCPGGLPTSFVPARNLLFLSAAVAFAASECCRDIVAGFCQADYSGYPDCRRSFVDAFETTAKLALPSSMGPIFVHTPLMDLSKADAVRLARKTSGCWEALAHTVTCYEGHVPGCGACPACVLRARGFAEAGETDPATTRRAP